MTGMLLFVVPVVVIEFALLVIAIIDLVKRENVRGGNKIVWAIIIVFIGVIGPILYFTLGRQEKPVDRDQN